MPIEYAEIILAVVALVAGVMYLFVRRRRVKAKSPKDAVRPSAPSRGAAAAAATTADVAMPGPAVQTWAPPPSATRVAPVSSTVVAPPPQPAAAAAAPAAPPAPSPSWD